MIDPRTQQPFSPAQRREKEKRAQEIKAQADKGEGFAALVKQYSDDLSTKDRGGEHTFARHSMSPDLEGFEAAAFSMKTNQISDLVESPYGFHIIKLLEKFLRPRSRSTKSPPTSKSIWPTWKSTNNSPSSSRRSRPNTT